MSTVYLAIDLCLLQFLSVSLSFSEYRSFTSLDLFLGMGLFSLFLSDSLFLVYRNASNLFVLILYPTTLPNWLMELWWFFDGISRISCIWYHVICKQWWFYFFLSSLDFFYLFIFPYLIDVGRTFSVLCWINVVRVGILVLFLILQERLSAFHHWV